MSEKVISAAVHAGVRAELVLRTSCIMARPSGCCGEETGQLNSIRLVMNDLIHLAKIGQERNCGVKIACHHADTACLLASMSRKEASCVAEQ